VQATNSPVRTPASEYPSGDEGGGIAVLDAASGKRLEVVAKLDAHPESFQIATSKPVIYANIATKAKVVLIDRNTHKVTD